ACGPQMRDIIRPVGPPGIDGCDGNQGNPGPKGSTTQKGMRGIQGPHGHKEVKAIRERWGRKDESPRELATRRGRRYRNNGRRKKATGNEISGRYRKFYKAKFHKISKLQHHHHHYSLLY
ncbi:unnamed protein product, partial [Cercopithifilaria johnstoni]